MPSYQFHQIDVFTRTPLTGNALAVFPDARGLGTDTMQALAREMNLSETTFVTPSDVATRRVRFFTPTAEIPLAGHPTIGTWWTLAELGLIDLPKEGTVRVTQETGQGVLPVDLMVQNGAPRRVVMTQAEPQFGARVEEIAELGRALGGDAGTVATRPPPEVVSTAIPQLMIPITTPERLTALPSGGSGASLVELLRRHGTECAMCFMLEVGRADIVARCRVFAPGYGVPEDPATGSAAGALGCYLVRHGLVSPRAGTTRVTVEQGAEIGRPSIIEVEILVDAAGAIGAPRVGGEAVTVISGEVRL